MMIGIFDSGVGGLTVLRAVQQALPGETFLYLGDTARLPYGTKSAATVKRYALAAACHLVDQGIGLLVVACNTASSHALDAVTRAVPVPVVGVVEPGVRATLATGARRVGVIGTEATIRSGAYQDSLARMASEVEVRACACPLLVPLAEEGWSDHPVTEAVASHYLAPLLEWGADALLLGCTHYPLLLPALARVAGEEVTLVDSASSVARVVATDLGPWPRSDGGGHVRLQLTDASDNFLRVARDILGELPGKVEVVDIGAAAPRGERA